MSEFPDEHLDRVYAAIREAECPNREGPYGLYDYTYANENPPAEPYRVRDWRDPRSDGWGRTVFSSEYREAAKAKYDQLTGRHIARAALEANQSTMAT